MKKFYYAAAAAAIREGRPELADEILHKGMQKAAYEISDLINNYSYGDKPIVLASMMVCIQALKAQLPESMVTGAELLAKSINKTVVIDLDKIKGGMGNE